jgi:osmotically-inducible protein OsmY
MNHSRIHVISLAVGLAFGTAAAAQNLSAGDYKAGKSTIAADYKSAMDACAPMTGNARDICRAEAAGTRSVARAELEERNRPGGKNRRSVSVAKANADYAVARERCDDKAAADRKACVDDARAAQSRALAEGRPATTAAPVATSKQETPTEYVDDSVITAKVKAAVLGEPTLKSAEINVETYKGKVQLSGFVRSRVDINKAVEVARTVKGVASVDNVMIVKGQQQR